MDTPATVVTPAVYGASDRPPRGDYSRGGTVQADSVSYTHLTLPTKA